MGAFFNVTDCGFKKRNAIKKLGRLWCLAFSQAHVAGLDDYICSKLIIISKV